MVAEEGDRRVGGGARDRVEALGSELRRLHDRIREVLDDALDATGGSTGSGGSGGTVGSGVGPEEALRASLAAVADHPASRCRAFCSVLAAHHEAEDAHLFPWLLRERPDLAPVVARLEQDHAVVGTLLADLARALERGASVAVLLTHLEGLDAIMESHFRFEERELVAALDAVPADADGPTLGDDFWRPRVRGWAQEVVAWPRTTPSS